MMQPVKYLLVLSILFASCRATRNAAVTTAPELTTQPVLMAYASSPNAATTTEVPAEFTVQEDVKPSAATIETPETAMATENVAAQKKATSFAQMKDMAKTGEIAMSKKDLKTLNKLEKHYKGDFKKFRADTFEFTTKAKIIAGIGLVGLLLAIFAGSGFGLFLFILAALAFILRYLDVIAF